MTARLASALTSVVLLCSCADNPASSTPLRLSATVTPNPLVAPGEPGDISWDLQLSASGSGSVLIERGDAQLLDASGVRVGHTLEYWSRSAGCSVCSGDVTIEDRRPERWSGKRIRYIGGGAPVRFVYTISYRDDLGPGTTTVEVPVR